MAKYSDIKGFTVQTLSTDTIANQAAGGSWASGGDMNTARRALASAGIQTAAITFGGYTTTQVALNEQYNGSSWTEVGDLNVAKHGIRGVGIYTAALAVGGFSPSASALNEIWDGSSWTEIGDLNTARGNFAGASGNGTTTAALVFGGYTSGPGATGTVAINESWDGSSWTEVGDLNSVGSQGPSGVGTSTAAIRASSNTQPSGYAPVENWDGSSWTAGTNMNTNRGEDPGANGTQTDALVYGGFTTPPATTRANTEAWDGTSWTEVTDLSTARYALTGCGTTGASSALAMGGYSTANHASTEEWTAPATFNQIQEGQLFFNSTANAFKETITDIPAATWASAPSLNTPAPANYARAQFGGGTSSNVAAGSNPNGTLCESFDGTSWSEFTEKSGGNTEKPGLGQSGTAGFVIGQNSNTAYVEEWNGSSWSEKADLNTGRNAMSTGGTITSGLVFGGETPQYDETESWNGSAWTEVADLNTGKAKAAGWGASNIDAISAVGFAPIHSPTYRKNTELWDGTSWTEVADTNDFHQSGGCSGFISTLGIVFAGDAQQPPGASRTTKTELWNGTSWTEINDTSVAAMDSGFGPSGKASSAMFITGDTSSGRVNSTEMFDASLANKTITAS